MDFRAGRPIPLLQSSHSKFCTSPLTWPSSSISTVPLYLRWILDLLMLALFPPNQLNPIIDYIDYCPLYNTACTPILVKHLGEFIFKKMSPRTPRCFIYLVVVARGECCCIVDLG